MTYDLLLQGGTLLDPAQTIHARKDIAFTQGRVAAIADAIPAAQARECLDCSGHFVSPGWIDLHVHVFAGVSHYGIPPDPHCIAHGVNLTNGYEEQKKAVASGHWPLYRFDPRLKDEGKNPLQIDSREPSIPLKDYIYSETRYKMLTLSNPEEAAKLLAEAEADVKARWRLYKHMAALPTE